MYPNEQLPKNAFNDRSVAEVGNGCKWSPVKDVTDGGVAPADSPGSVHESANGCGTGEGVPGAEL